MVSLPATQKYVRNQDIWDLTWLKQQGAAVNALLVRQKVVDYKIEDFSQIVDLRIASISDTIEGDSFNNEMKLAPTKSKFGNIDSNTA